MAEARPEEMISSQILRSRPGFLSRPLPMHDLRGNYILSLNKPGTTSYVLISLFSYVSAKLRNALPDFIRTYEFTGFKRESRAAFCTAAFLFNEYFFKYYVVSRYPYMLCILAVNVMSRRCYWEI